VILFITVVIEINPTVWLWQLSKPWCITPLFMLHNLNNIMRYLMFVSWSL